MQLFTCFIVKSWGQYSLPLQADCTVVVCECCQSSLGHGISVKSWIERSWTCKVFFKTFIPRSFFTSKRVAGSWGWIAWNLRDSHLLITAYSPLIGGNWYDAVCFSLVIGTLTTHYRPEASGSKCETSWKLMLKLRYKSSSVHLTCLQFDKDGFLFLLFSNWSSNSGRCCPHSVLCLPGVGGQVNPGLKSRLSHVEQCVCEWVVLFPQCRSLYIPLLDWTT